jgi:hypothetical protein
LFPVSRERLVDGFGSKRPSTRRILVRKPNVGRTRRCGLLLQPSAQHTAAGIAGLVANIAGGHVSKSWCLLSDGLVKLTRANRGPGRRRP